VPRRGWLGGWRGASATSHLAEDTGHARLSREGEGPRKRGTLAARGRAPLRQPEGDDVARAGGAGRRALRVACQRARSAAPVLQRCGLDAQLSSAARGPETILASTEEGTMETSSDPGGAFDRRSAVPAGGVRSIGARARALALTTQRRASCRVLTIEWQIEACRNVSLSTGRPVIRGLTTDGANARAPTTPASP